MGRCLRGEEVHNKLLNQSGCGGESAREWIFSGAAMDYEHPIVACGLCGAPNMRFAFEIRHAYRNESLWVGAGCLTHHGFTIQKEGQALAYGPGHGYVGSLIREMRREGWFNGLMRIYSLQGHPEIYEALIGYQIHGHFTPTQAAIVFDAMEKQKMRYDPSCFRIWLTSETSQNELRKLPPWKVWRFWSVLTPRQRLLAKSMGHREPPPSSRPVMETWSSRN